MNGQSQTEVSRIRGDGALSSILGGYDQKINKLAEEVAQGFSSVEVGLKDGASGIQAAKDELVENQKRSADALATQLLAIKKSIDDLSAIRHFERENPVMLEVIQSLCAMPREVASYSANEGMIKRLLNLVEDLEVSLGRTGLTLDRDLAGGAARFARIYKPDVTVPTVVTPCVMRESTVVRKGTALCPEGERPREAEAPAQRMFEAIDVDTVV